MSKASITAQHSETHRSNCVIRGLIAVDEGDFGGGFKDYIPPKDYESDFDMRIVLNTHGNRSRARLYLSIRDRWFYTDLKEVTYAQADSE